MRNYLDQVFCLNFKSKCEIFSRLYVERGGGERERGRVRFEIIGSYQVGADKSEKFR